MNTYKTRGVCSSAIEYEIKDGVIESCRFIGGCAGHLMINGRRTIVFNGDLESHPDCKEITSFIKDRDIDIVSFADYPLTDIGSILYGRPYLC